MRNRLFALTHAILNKNLLGHPQVVGTCGLPSDDKYQRGMEGASRDLLLISWRVIRENFAYCSCSTFQATIVLAETPHTGHKWES